MGYEIVRYVGTGIEEFANCWRAVEEYFEIFDFINEDEFREWREEYSLDMHPDRTLDVVWEYWDDKNFQLAYGETKNTLLVEGEWVVKLPSWGLRGHDYCRDEVEYWGYAEQEGLQKYFAETVQIGEFRLQKKDLDFRVPVYAQRKVGFEYDEERVNKAYSKEANETTFRVYGDAEDFGTDSGLVACWIDFCGVEVAQRLMDFIATYDITDVHESNWGWREGIPCVYDFSGYHGRY